jgi:hypothetical protein
MDFGIGFVELAIGDDRDPAPISLVPPHPDRARDQTYLVLVAHLQQRLTGGDKQMIDDLVTALHFHIIVPEFQDHSAIEELQQVCWGFLQNSNYRANGVIAGNFQQALVMSLLDDLDRKTSPLEKAAHPDAVFFPGVSSDKASGDIELDLVLPPNYLVSTGLWINAGAMGVISSQESDILVQIGSHERSLLNCRGPWHRWPLATIDFPIVPGSNQVLSQFGGPVYFSSTSKTTRSAKFVFQGFLRAPRFVLGTPAVYERSKDAGALWGELVTKYTCITLLSADLHRLASAQPTIAAFDQAIVAVTNFLSYQIVRPYRILFDHDITPGKEIAAFPISLSYEDLNDVFPADGQPTLGLIRALTSIGIVSLRDGCYNGITEYALASVAVFSVLTKKTETVNPLEGPLALQSPLFRLLWVAHTQIGEPIIENLLKKTREPETPVYDDSEDKWLQFVTDISESSHFNFVPLLKSVHPISANLGAALEQYKPPPLSIPWSMGL